MPLILLWLRHARVLQVYDLEPIALILLNVL